MRNEKREDRASRLYRDMPNWQSMAVREFEAPTDTEFQIAIGQPANPQWFASVGDRLGAHIAARAVIDLNGRDLGHTDDGHDPAPGDQLACCQCLALELESIGSHGAVEPVDLVRRRGGRSRSLSADRHGQREPRDRDREAGLPDRAERRLTLSQL